MNQKVVTNAAPAAIGPYSQGIISGKLVFFSGQIALDPSTGIMSDESIVSETHQVLKNIGGLLSACGIGFQQVVKVSVFVTDMGQYSVINEIYGQYFKGEALPARELVQVSALPRGGRIEISVIASLD
jgi:2-iminobutanoate/2-iminopropanoate deaminase